MAKNDKNSTRNKTQTKPVITAKNGKNAARNSSHTKTVVTAKNKATGRNSSPVKKTSVVKAHAQNNTPKERNNQKIGQHRPATYAAGLCWLDLRSIQR